jgi:hypothetical protein
MNEGDIFLLIVGGCLTVLGLAIMLTEVLRTPVSPKESEAELVLFSTNLSGVLTDFSGMFTLFHVDAQGTEPDSNSLLENDF